MIPLYLYEGKWLFAHGTAGAVFTLIKNDRFSLSAVGQYRFQKLDPDQQTRFIAGLEERRQTVDVGLRAQLDRRNWGRLSACNTSQTGSTGTTVTKHNCHTGMPGEFGSWLLSPYVAWGLQSANLANYYFGVSEAEARPDLPAYAPGESQFLTYGLNSSYQVTERVLAFRQHRVFR